MEDMDVPSSIFALWQDRGYAGSSLELEAIRTHLKELWALRVAARGGVARWRSLLARSETMVARLRPSPQREEAKAVLRSCCASFKARCQMSWRPHIVLALGLLGEPLASLQQFDKRGVKRCW